ncbi:terminase large subunit [Phenylobacterium sp.]|uniref:terminase large subunit n=1 Tax=Phenylobacterium sp. TaxID=1871053 RepID=UPI0027339326|nr:terminase TerL endonuclease subunit [Phenylobacterium sp.]MDP3853628.1 terminase large subunit [Phenylobacterium sp.]
MDGSLPLSGEASAAALAAGAPESIWPLPAWLESTADDPSYEWARNRWRRAAQVPGAWFDYALADEMVRQWPHLMHLTQDRFAGLPFKLNLWQEIIVRLMVGWQRPDEQLDAATHEPVIYQVRVFRRLMLWVPRKNGKSEFLAALGLLFFLVDGVIDGEGYCFARDEKQARIVLRKMKAMIALNPDWSAGVLPYKRSFYVKDLLSTFEMLTGAEDGKHGASPTVVIGDEMHEWRSRVIAETLEEGTGARLQPVFLYGSTAGPKGNIAGDDCWSESQGILEGRIDDPHTLVCIFAADPEDDPLDEATWRKANPSIGLSPTLSYLRTQAAKAKDNPRALARFCCYHLNLWIDAAVRWFNVKKWDACAGSKDGWLKYPETLKGRPCFGGFDVSSTTDVTALIWVFPPTDDDAKWRVLCRFWVPEDTLRDRVASDRVPYDQFKAVGALETTPGDYVDQNYIKRAIEDGLRDFDVVDIGFDSWNARKLYTDLLRDNPQLDGRVIEMRQGIQTLGEPSKHFERLVYAGLLDHGGNPVMRWMAQNVVVRFDENLNYMPAKKRSREKIDGIVAAVMAVGLACRGEEAEPANPWEDENFSLSGPAN